MMDKEKTKVDALREVLKAKKEAEEQRAEVFDEQLTSHLAPRAPDYTDDLSAQIRAAEEEAKTHYDKLLRVMAEFENFKKRTERERLEAMTFANQRLLEDLLPVLDHLDEALANVDVAAQGGETMRGLCEGVALTQKQFLGILARHGLEPIEPEIGTPFDPAVHEAMTQVDAEGVAAGTVAMRYRRGYRLHGRVVRAALVSVAK